MILDILGLRCIMIYLDKEGACSTFVVSDTNDLTLRIRIIIVHPLCGRLETTTLSPNYTPMDNNRIVENIRTIATKLKSNTEATVNTNSTESPDPSNEDTTMNSNPIDPIAVQNHYSFVIDKNNFISFLQQNHNPTVYK